MDVEHLSSDPRRGIRRGVGDGVGNVLRPTETTKRTMLLKASR